MAEKSSFKQGSANANTQNKPTDADVARADEYNGSYKDPALSISEEEKFGNGDNPVQTEKLPAKNLRSSGG